MKRLIGVTGILVWALTSSACVSKGKYQTALTSLKQCESDRDSARSELAKTKEELDAKIAALNEQLEAVGGEKDKMASEFAADKQATMAELQDLRKQRAAIEKSLEAWRSLTARFQKMIDAGKLQVQIRRGRMIVQLPSSVLFASGKADLSDDGKQAIAEVASVLKDFDNRRFIVTGHTDSVPIRSSKFADNWELSVARALTVTKFLIENGMDPHTLVAGGYGEYDPIGNNKSPQGRQRNRRIEIVLLPNIEELPAMPKG